MAQATAKLTISLGVLGAEQLSALTKGLERLSAVSKRLQMPTLSTSGTAAVESAARRQAAAMESAAGRRIAAGAKAASAEIKGIRSVEQEMARLQRLAEQRGVTAEARSRLGMQGPSLFTGHGFTSRARQGLGLVRDLTVAGMGVRYAFGAATGAVRAMTGPVMDFESALADARNKGGFSLSQMAEIANTAKRMGRTSQFSATQAAGGAVELAAAGLNAPDIAKQLPTVLRFAQASGLSTETASATLVESMSQFGLQASDFERIGDVMVKAANMSTISVGDMSESLKYVGPIASTAGADIEQVSAMIALLGERGIKGSMAGTGLRSVITSLAHPAKMARKAMAEVGLTKADMQAGLSDLPGFLQKLDAKMKAKGLSTPKRLEIEKMLFGTEAISSVESLMSSMTTIGKDGKTAWDGYNEGVRKAGGAMSKAADIAGNTLAGKMARLHAAVETAQISLGEKLAPVLTKLLPQLANAAVGVGKWIEANGSLVGTFATLTPAIAGSGLALKGLLGTAALLDKLPVSLVGRATALGSTFGTTFAAAVLAGVVGYGLTTALLKVLDIDMERAGKRLFEITHGLAETKEGVREMTPGQVIRAEREKNAPKPETDPILAAIQASAKGVPPALAPMEEFKGVITLDINSKGVPTVAKLTTTGKGPSLRVGTNVP